MSQRLASHRHVIALWPSIRALARDVRSPDATVRQWQYRNSIPAAHWAKIITAAARRLSFVLSMDELQALAPIAHPRPKRPRATPTQRRAAAKRRAAKKLKLAA